MLTLHLDACTVNSRKVLAGAELLGVPYQAKHVDYFTGAHKAPEYAAINPMMEVPSLTDGNFVLTESNSILQYMADLAKTDIHYPKDLKTRAEVNKWLNWEAANWFPSCYVYLVEFVVKPLLKAKPDLAVADKEGSTRFNKLAGILDARLKTSPWLAGPNPTIADIAVASPMHLHRAQCLPLGNYPNLARWMTAGVEKLPAWQKTQGAVDRALLPAAA